MTDDKVGQVQSELSVGGTKRDVENTPKCARSNCILARRSSLVKDTAAKTSLRVNSAMQTGQVPKFLALKCQVLQALNTEQGPTNPTRVSTTGLPTTKVVRSSV